MSAKKTFKIKLDAEFTIDFDGYGFSDAEQSKTELFKEVILNNYFINIGYDEVEVTEKKDISLFETMSEMFNPNKK